MGFVISSPDQGGKIVASSKPTGLEELEDEGEWVCIVCREGFKFKPEEVMGIYAYSKRTEITFGGVPVRQDRCFTTVTHFNLIHFSCHSEAARADRTGKRRKDEWEGARLRNSDTKCNILFPIMVDSPFFLLFWDEICLIVACLSRALQPQSLLTSRKCKATLLNLMKSGHQGFQGFAFLPMIWGAFFSVLLSRNHSLLTPKVGEGLIFFSLSLLFSSLLFSLNLPLLFLFFILYSPCLFFSLKL